VRAAAARERVEDREAMVVEALLGAGVRDPVVLRAMRACPRHRFVPEGLQRAAYDNRPLPIGEDQTISQPTIVGAMTEELRLTPSSRVLEIGTGSGYQAAVLAEITPHVFSVEIRPGLAARARKTLDALGYGTVATRTGDGYHGWPEEAPFDAILVTAAAPHVPPPLVRQLKPGGRLVLPVGPPFQRQDLVLVTKDEGGKVSTRSLYSVAFVPLTGSLGREGD
jgi:protein-L-isoaspartate(D-aspartate) O-methyltransferase